MIHQFLDRAGSFVDASLAHADAAGERLRDRFDWLQRIGIVATPAVLILLVALLSGRPAFDFGPQGSAPRERDGVGASIQRSATNSERPTGAAVGGVAATPEPSESDAGPVDSQAEPTAGQDQSGQDENSISTDSAGTGSSDFASEATLVFAPAPGGPVAQPTPPPTVAGPGPTPVPPGPTPTLVPTTTPAPSEDPSGEPPDPTPQPTSDPTADPTVVPTPVPTPVPTAEPTPDPTPTPDACILDPLDPICDILP